jgi:hypothetical protein
VLIALCSPAIEAQGLEESANWQDQSAAYGQLVKQRLRNVVGRGGHDNGVEGCLFGPTLAAIAHANSDVAVAQFRQGAFSLASQRFQDLDRQHLVGKLREDGGLVSGSRSHLQHLVCLFKGERLCHHGNQRGL